MEVNIQPRETSQGHFYVSLLKSAVRIVAGVAIMFGALMTGGGLIVLAECLGILEEII